MLLTVELSSISGLVSIFRLLRYVVIRRCVYPSANVALASRFFEYHLSRGEGCRQLRQLSVPHIGIRRRKVLDFYSEHVENLFRYREIENFKVEPFWKLVVEHTRQGQKVDFAWAQNRLFDREMVNVSSLGTIYEPSSLRSSTTIVWRQEVPKWNT